MSEGYNVLQEAVVHWLPVATAVISFCCSAVLAVHICYRSSRKTYHRFLFVLSVFDMLASSSGVVSRFLDLTKPSTTCSVVGMVQAVAVGTSALYNACLAILFLLLVKFGTNEPVIVKYFEIPAHVGSIFGIIIAASAAYLLEAINPVSFSALCWPGAYPEGCHGDECIRGEAWGFFFHQLSHTVFYVVATILAASNTVIYFKVRKTLGRNRRYSVEASGSGPRASSSTATDKRHQKEPQERSRQERRLSSSSVNTRRADSADSNDPQRGKSVPSLSSNDSSRSKTRQVAIRSFLFCGGFALSYSFAIVISEITRWAHNSPIGTWWFYTLMILDSMFWPLQGFWDSVIYFRPRYVQWRSACPVNSRWFALRKTLFTMEKPSASRIARAQQWRSSLASTNNEMKPCEALASISVPLRDLISTNNQPSPMRETSKQ